MNPLAGSVRAQLEAAGLACVVNSGDGLCWAEQGCPLWHVQLLWTVEWGWGKCPTCSYNPAYNLVWISSCSDWMVIIAVTQDIPNTQVFKILLLSHLLVNWPKKVIWLSQVQEMEQYTPPFHNIHGKEEICGHLEIKHNHLLAIIYVCFFPMENMLKLVPEI